MLDDLNFKILDDSEYKEDSVREDIIMPILKRLGYSSTGVNKIKRGIPLTHPFVNIGSTKRKINIIPDYILETENGFKWILDAKSPNENIIKSKNVEQAYSYAINPEVRCNIYALCNGRTFTAFHISEIKPLLELHIEDIEDNWELINQVLSPIFIEKPHLIGFFPDFGIHLDKVGAPLDTILYFIPALVQNISKVNDDLYTLFAVVNYGGEEYGASFDFKAEKFQSFIESVPSELRDYIKNGLKQAPYLLHFNSLEKMFPIVIEAKRGTKVYSNNNESYIPLNIESFDNIA